MKKGLLVLALLTILGFISSDLLAWGGPGYRGYGPGWGMGPGMMWGYGGNGPGGWGNYPYDYSGRKIKEHELRQIAQNYLRSTGDPDLTFTGYIEYGPGYAIGFKEKSSGLHAFEIYINKINESVYPEMGPYMMWNLKYGHMMMMGGYYYYRSASQMPVTEEKAVSLAKEFIKASFPKASLDNDAEVFYGFYEFVIKEDGKPYTHLFINGYSGQYWFWNPHGPIIQIRKFK
jgi:hypothetical protein